MPTDLELSGRTRRSGFSLVELVMVIVVMLVLAGILYPVITGARKSAQAGASRMRLVQWSMALESYVAEYGALPLRNEGTGDYVIDLGDPDICTNFINLLEGRDPLNNPRNLVFYRFADDERADPSLENTLLQDAFGNSEIWLLVDGDRDGWVRVEGYGFRGQAGAVSRSDLARGFPEVCSWR